MSDDLDRLRELAGVQKEKSSDGAIVLLPDMPVEAMRRLLDRLKEIAEEPDTDWTTIHIDGVPYKATGVVRDL